MKIPRNYDTIRLLGAAVIGLGAVVSASSAFADRVVTLRLGADFDTLDPVRTVGSDGYQMVNVLYDRLVALDASGKPQPALATSWTGDASSTVFTLNPNATCADGTPVTPTVVANSLTRLGAPETNAPMAYRTFGTGGYEVTADDAGGTVTINMTKPFSDLLVGLAMPWASIVCPAGIADPEALATTAQGSGPYVIDAAASMRGANYALKLRRDHTWAANGATGADAGRPETITVRIINNNTTAANELLAGTVDISIVTGQEVNRLRDGGTLDFVEAIPFGMQFLMYQHREGHPTADIAVRRAIATAIDRELVARIATSGNGVAATSYISTQVACYDPTTKDLLPTADLGAAQAILTEAGYAKDSRGIFAKDGVPVKLRIVGVPQFQGSAPEYLMEVIRSIGFDVELRNITLQEIFPTMSGATWDIGVFPFGPPMPSANTVAAFVSGDAPTNYGAVHNAKFDAAHGAALAASPDSPQRCVEWGTAQRALLEETNILPLFGTINTFFSSKDVSFGLNSAFVLDIQTIRLK